MPALHPVDKVLRLRHVHTIGSETNTGWHLYLQTATVVTPVQLQALTDAAMAGWSASLGAVTATNTAITRVDGLDLSSATGAVASSGGSHSGTASGGFLPASSCVVNNFTIPRRYRGGKPRVYIPAGVQPSLATGQTWSAAFLNSFTSAWNAYFNALKASVNTWSQTCNVVNVSYYQGGSWVNDQHGRPHWVPTPRPVPQVDVVSAAVPAAIVGSQRRRLHPG